MTESISVPSDNAITSEFSTAPNFAINTQSNLIVDNETKELPLASSAAPVPVGITNNSLVAQNPSSSSEPTQANKRNYVGLTVGSIFQIPAYGLTAKIGVADNISVRPFIQFAKVPRIVSSFDGANDVNIDGFIYGLSATYDFNIPKSDFIPYAGIGLANASGTATSSNPTPSSSSGFTSPVYIELGADYNFTDNITINANYKFQDLGFFSFGAGYRF